MDNPLDDADDIVFDENHILPGDSSANLLNSIDPNILHVYQTGEQTVVGFAGCDIPDDFCIAYYRDHLTKIVDEGRCKLLTIDLSSFKLIPSGMLGLLISLRKKVDRIELCNPCKDIREVLHVTYFENRFDIKDVFEFGNGHENS